MRVQLFQSAFIALVRLTSAQYRSHLRSLDDPDTARAWLETNIILDSNYQLAYAQLALLRCLALDLDKMM